MNMCRQCNADFTSVSAFDAHQNDDGKPVVCNVQVKWPKGHPNAGKPVLEQMGERNGGPLYKFADYGQFDWAKPGAAPVERDTERPCTVCGNPMRKSKPGRGRWPSKCEVDGGTGIPV